MLALRVLCILVISLKISNAELRPEYTLYPIPRSLSSIFEWNVFMYRKFINEKLWFNYNPICMLPTNDKKRICQTILGMQKIKDLIGAEYNITADSRSRVFCEEKKVGLLRTSVSMFQCPTTEPTGDFFEGQKFFVSTDYDDGYYLFHVGQENSTEAITINRIMNVEEGIQ